MIFRRIDREREDTMKVFGIAFSLNMCSMRKTGRSALCHRVTPFLTQSHILSHCARSVIIEPWKISPNLAGPMHFCRNGIHFMYEYQWKDCTIVHNMIIHVSEIKYTRSLVYMPKLLKSSKCHWFSGNDSPWSGFKNDTLRMYQFISKSSKKGQSNFMTISIFIISIYFNLILIINFSNIYSMNQFILHLLKMPKSSMKLQPHRKVTGHSWYFKDDSSFLSGRTGISRAFLLFEGQQMFVSYIYIYIPNIRESGGLKVSKLN